MNAAIDDLRASLRMLPVAAYFAWSDTKARYRRSILGPFWIVIGTAFASTGLGYIWSRILKVDPTVLVPSLTIGIVIWQLISGSLVEAPSAFVRNAQVIRNIRSPLLMFPLQLLARQLINFCHNFLLVVVVMVVYVRDWSFVQLLFFPSLLLVCLNLMWVMTIMATIGARFRDLEPSVGALMPMLFFLSPVVYRPEYLGQNSLVVLYNPIAYFILALREPLQGVVPDIHVYTVLIAMVGIGWILALALLAYRHSRVAFWV